LEIGTVFWKLGRFSFPIFFKNKKKIIKLIEDWKREPSQFPENRPNFQFFPSPILNFVCSADFKFSNKKTLIIKYQNAIIKSSKIRKE